MKLDSQILRKKNDDREYRYVELDNGIKCFLVRDPCATKSAAAVAVSAGSGHDPKGRQGIAHFVQHMLFMGSQEYPSENHFGKFINQNAGYSNAYTSNNHTMYHYKVANQGYLQSLKIFSCFFSCPLFKAQTVDREREAVHSQHMKNLQSDLHRHYQISKSLSRPKCSYNKFSTGSRETLSGQSIRDEMMQFYQQHYSANLMSLVLASPASLDDMQQVSRQLFGRVPNKNLAKFQQKQSVYPKELLSKLVKVKSVNKANYLFCSFVIRSLHDKYLENPFSYFCHLVGHEGKGSLLSTLLKQGLAYQLQAYRDIAPVQMYSSLQIKITLTDKGLQQHQKVIELVVSYLKLLRKKGALKQIFQQIKQVEKQKMQNAEKQRIDSLVIQYAKVLECGYIQPIYTPISKYLTFNYDQALLNQLVQLFLLQNSIFMLTSDHIELQPGIKKTEPVYKTQYSQQPIPQSLYLFQKSDQILGQLDLPPLNPYLALKAELRQGLRLDEQAPRLVYKSPKSECYFKADLQCNSAKVVFQVGLFRQHMGVSGKQKNLKEICQQLLKNYLREQMYMAETAGLKLKISFITSNLQFIFEGFDEKMQIFIKNIFTEFKQFKISACRNDIANSLDKVRKRLQNLKNENPYHTIYQTQAQLFVENQYASVQDRLAAFDITQQQLQEWLDSSLRKIQFKFLSIGNVDEQWSIQSAKSVEQIFHQHETCPSQAQHKFRVIKPQSNIQYFFDLQTQQRNSAYLQFYQLYQKTPFNKVKAMLLHLFFKERFFHRLRTLDNVGYVAMALLRQNRGYLGLAFLTQSQKYNVDQLKKRYQFFFQEVRTQLSQIKEQSFTVLKAAVRSIIDQKQFDLKRKASRFWSQIQDGSLLFERKEMELKEIDRVALQEFKKEALQLIESRCCVHMYCNSYLHRNSQKLPSKSIKRIQRECKLWGIWPG